jgi:acetolactate synthase-1/2/3 large subunit
MSRTGGQLIVEALQTHGADRLFCVPGESYLAVLDALYESPIGVTVCRQEGGAAMMADAYGRLTGQPGICFVTRGPGATNASSGLHIARQDSAPMILFIGQVQRAAREREAFQEIEYRRMMTELAKWVGEIDSVERIPEFVARAFATATSGRPGPVVLALPEDVLRESADVPPQKPYTPVEIRPGRAGIAALESALAAAQRPIAILGGGGWNETAVAQMANFAERFALPVTCSFRRQMLFDHLHANYAGDVGLGINPKLAARIRGADLVLLVGGRFGETPSGDYSLLAAPNPDQTLVHVHADAAELGRVYRPDIAINASPAAFAEDLAALTPPDEAAWAGEAAIAHADYLDWSEPSGSNPGAVQMGEIMRWLRDALPEDAILTNGAGNYAGWQHRYYHFRRFGTQLAPASGSMGYGVPAAVAAKQLYPDRPVVAFSGDGCFMMNGQEFATAVQYGLPIIVLLINNGIYGTIRMHQEIRHPGRVVATDLVNPDFAALARAYGGHGETVRETAEFAPAFERAADSGKPAIIDIHIDPEAITTTKSLSELRGAAG